MHTNRPPYNHKRQHSEHPLEPSPKQAHKKQKIDHPSGCQLPAPFWDNLSNVWLTRNALRELDRRNVQTAPSVLSQFQPFRPVSIQRFARQGGPDLSELRGYPEPNMSARLPNYRVRKRTVGTSRGSSASRGSSTSRSTKPSTTKSSGPYDRNFQQNLIDHGIFPHRYKFPDGHMPSKPGNWDDILRRLAERRSSLSPSRFGEENFEEFLQADADASKEKNVTESVIPFIEGKTADNKCIGGGIPFRNLDHLTDGTLVPGNPDRYYGARPEQLNRQIRSELHDQIVPSTQHDLPIVPNFFLAAKGPDGSASVARRQANYDGALGARGIRSLQAYKQSEPNFDNNAYTLTSIYHNGQLQMFTCHPSKSATSDRPEYYLTQLGSFSLTHDVEVFRQGATWYRNGRDWAKEQRDDAIEKANQRVSHELVESATINASFTTVRDISDNESVVSITQQSYFSFTNKTDTPDESIRSTRSDSPKRSREKNNDS